MNLLYSDSDDIEENEEESFPQDDIEPDASLLGREQSKDIDGVREIMLRGVSDFAELSCLSKTMALILLRHFDWSAQTAQEEYFLNSSELLAALKQDESSAAREGTVVLSSSSQCMICGDTEEDGTTRGLEACQHFFCSQCWRDEVDYKMEKGEELFDVRCMGKCNELISNQNLFSLCGFAASDREVKEIIRYITAQYANQSSHFSRCINSPACPGYVYLPIKHIPAPTAHCDFCNADFCFICRRTRHTPASCTEVQRWEEQIDHDSASTSCVFTTTKGCPKCHRRVEKNKGCLHMTCQSPCFYQFCWNCLGPWEENHDNFRCDHAEDLYAQKTGFSESQKDFLTLFHGYNQHKVKIREEEVRIEQICLRISDFTAKLANHGVLMTPYAVAHLLQSAKSVLCKSRTTLMYSYVKQWFTKNERERNLLYHRMNLLENVTLKLSVLMNPDSEMALATFQKEVEGAMNAVNAWVFTILDDASV